MTKRSTVYFLIAAGIMAFIFINSAMPADVSNEESGFLVRWIAGLFHREQDADFCGTLTFLVRKGAHFTEYLCLGLCLSQGARYLKGLRSSRGIFVFFAFAAAWITGTLFAATDELHQIFVPGRSCELRDIGIDAAGVLFGVLLSFCISLWKKEKPRMRHGK